MLTLIVGIIIGFYVLVVLSAFLIAISYFLKTNKSVDSTKIYTPNYTIEYIPELDVWYCYLNGKYICSGISKEECEKNANIL